MHHTTATTPPRNLAFDFTKGALVLIMVVYHWLNYFIGPGYDFYRYLRFLTPAFIFITGFLVSHIYLSKYDPADKRLPNRLMRRGLKLLTLFTFLNIAVSSLVGESYNGRLSFVNASIPDLVSIYVVGNVLIPGSGKAAVFYILIPIAYLLMVSALLIYPYRAYRYTFHITAVVFLISIFCLHLYDTESPNLELLTTGLLGATCGFIPIKTINEWTRHYIVILITYCGYIGAITRWNVRYPLQIFGVGLSVALLYTLGAARAVPNRGDKIVILLGEYSLVAYIAQVGVLQILYRGMRPLQDGAAPLAVSMAAALCLTIVTVAIIDQARKRVAGVDRLYRLVFS